MLFKIICAMLLIVGKLLLAPLLELFKLLAYMGSPHRPSSSTKYWFACTWFEGLLLSVGFLSCGWLMHPSVLNVFNMFTDVSFEPNSGMAFFKKPVIFVSVSGGSKKCMGR